MNAVFKPNSSFSSPTQLPATASLPAPAPPELPDWQLQNAKNRFSQVVRAAREGVPQWVTVHGKRAAVVLSAQQYENLQRQHDAPELCAAPAPKMSLVEALRMDLPEGGLTDEEVDALFARPKEPSRAHGYEF